MPTFDNLESLASVRAKINNAISNSETALTRLDNNDADITGLDVRVTDLEAGAGGTAWGGHHWNPFVSSGPSVGIRWETGCW